MAFQRVIVSAVLLICIFAFSSVVASNRGRPNRLRNRESTDSSDNLFQDNDKKPTPAQSQARQLKVEKCVLSNRAGLVSSAIPVDLTFTKMAAGQASSGQILVSAFMKPQKFDTKSRKVVLNQFSYRWLVPTRILNPESRAANGIASVVVQAAGRHPRVEFQVGRTLMGFKFPLVSYSADPMHANWKYGSVFLKCVYAKRVFEEVTAGKKKV